MEKGISPLYSSGAVWVWGGGGMGREVVEAISCFLSWDFTLSLGTILSLLRWFILPTFCWASRGHSYYLTSKCLGEWCFATVPNLDKFYKPIIQTNSTNDRGVRKGFTMGMTLGLFLMSWLTGTGLKIELKNSLTCGPMLGHFRLRQSEKDQENY